MTSPKAYTTKATAKRAALADLGKGAKFEVTNIAAASVRY